MTDYADELKKIHDWQVAHEAEDKKAFGELKDDIKDIKDDINSIKNNHLFHIERDMNTVKVAIERNTTNSEWLKWLIGAVLLGMLGVFWASFK